MYKDFSFSSKIGMLLTILSFCFIGFLHSQDSYEDFVDQQSAGFDEFQDEYKNYKKVVTEEFDLFYKAEQDAYKKYKDEIEQKWGEFKGSTNKDWVEYNSDKTTRTSVDFEKGEIKVEVLIRDDESEETGSNEASHDLEAKEKIEKAITDLISSKGKTNEFETLSEKSEKLLDKPILEKQIETEDGNQIDENNAKEYAKEVVSEKKISFKNTIGNDGVKRKKFSITLPLAPDHLKERAKIYLPIVLKYSQKYNLLVSLVLAVIHTESYYNPKARSHVPAYGLMQLVPRSGARDAYNFVYKDDKLVRSSYLYNPENNIELGVAYLYLLKNRYFKGVKDDISKDFCAIAGYNTGPGNVCKAFTGKTKLKSAIAKINTMSSVEVYNRLRNYLPYDETRKYLEKVRDRMALYEE